MRQEGHKVAFRVRVCTDKLHEGTLFHSICLELVPKSDPSPKCLHWGDSNVCIQLRIVLEISRAAAKV